MDNVKNFRTKLFSKLVNIPFTDQWTVIEISTIPIVQHLPRTLWASKLFRFYCHFNMWASAKFMHLIKHMRIRASAENSKLLLTDRYLKMFNPFPDKWSNQPLSQIKYDPICLNIIRPSCITIVWAKWWENLFMSYANNKGADQPAHLCSLISTFVVCFLDSIVPLVSISEISSL